jgi:hypothetical protein
MTEIAQCQLPPRRDRHNARVVKRKMSTYHLKRAEHYAPPKPTLSLSQAIRILVASK